MRHGHQDSSRAAVFCRDFAVPSQPVLDHGLYDENQGMAFFLLKSACVYHPLSSSLGAHDFLPPVSAINAASSRCAHQSRALSIRLCCVVMKFLDLLERARGPITCLNSAGSIIIPSTVPFGQIAIQNQFKSQFYQGNGLTAIRDAACTPY
ncbi:hypothetical protein B0H19DRAFT_1083988 [Mycena capillaripes]|nr:hypothetical protein B0H19DRAFT_1083988 [Mycena capillaripes]